MKYLGKLFATALVSLLAMGNVAQAQDMTFFRIGTGGAGGTYFPIGGLIANAISSPPGARSCEKGGTCGVPGLIAIAVSTNATGKTKSGSSPIFILKICTWSFQKERR
jgi:hypothetical protein